VKFFLDENFPKKATPILESKGHQTFDIRGTTFEGVVDKNIFELAQDQKATFLTTDKDFFHTIQFQYETHYGIIVIALSQPNAPKILEKLKFALKFIETHEIHSNCILLKDNRIYMTKQNL
jgi:predicted nuclease of predicted toxin-antitoxin system